MKKELLFLLAGLLLSGCPTRAIKKLPPKVYTLEVPPLSKAPSKPSSRKATSQPSTCLACDGLSDKTKKKFGQPCIWDSDCQVGLRCPNFTGSHRKHRGGVCTYLFNSRTKGQKCRNYLECQESLVCTGRSPKGRCKTVKESATLSKIFTCTEIFEMGSTALGHILTLARTKNKSRCRKAYRQLQRYLKVWKFLHAKQALLCRRRFRLTFLQLINRAASQVQH